MAKFKYCFLLLITISCLGVVKPDTETKRLFEKYLLTFRGQTLPFKMDRKAVFEMMNFEDNFSEIKDSLEIFIPEELKSNHPNSKFISMYLFPEYNDIIVVLILQNFVNDYGIRVVKNHLVTYSKKGDLIDCQELAGVVLDAWEAFLEISKDYLIKRELYQFRINNESNQTKYFNLTETIYNYTITTSGLIKEIETTIREGYFEGDWSGYRFIKSIEESSTKK